MSEELKVLGEVHDSICLRNLHPLRLDRWHRTLLGLPEEIYMQYGCTTLLEHVQQASALLRAMIDLLGVEGLPVAPQEIAQRSIRSFRWFLKAPDVEELREFEASWDKESSSWKLKDLSNPSVTSTASKLEEAFKKSIEWASGNEG